MIDLWQEIYSTIKRNKLRTLLTGFAVAWGIFMLIVLLGAGNGLINAFSEYSQSRAINSMKVYGGSTSMPYDGLKQGRWIQLDNTDLDITGSHFEDFIIETGATVWQGGIVLSHGKEYVTHSFGGVYPNFTEVEAITCTKGRFINELDIRERRKVIVIHEKNAEILFRDEDPLGKFVMGNGIAYQVIGLFSELGDMDPREAYVPFTTLQTIYNKGDKLNNISFTIKNLETEADHKAFETLYRKTLSGHHRYAPEDKSAIWIWNRFTDYLQQQNAMGILRTALWIIGIFTLLSGIVGVSNIMLITVKERTHEFGIRKALGAKPSSILWLIIVESVFITGIFGYIGMVAGIGVTEYMNVIMGTQTIEMGGWQETIFKNPTVNINVAIQATLTLIVAGTLAGFFPARKAVKIRPIEALRAD